MQEFALSAKTSREALTLGASTNSWGASTNSGGTSTNSRGAPTISMRR